MLEAFEANGEVRGFGSGFIVRSDGIVVSNYHVIKGAAKVRVKTKSGKSYDVIGVIDFDAAHDYAILKIKDTKLPTIKMGDPKRVEIGMQLVAIGHPRGLDYTVSTGILSQRRKNEGVEWLQHTASISPGSSGGPLLNMRGEVVGINTAYRADGQQLNFAIPIGYINTALAANTVVQYTVAAVSAHEAERGREQARAWVADNFSQYKDRAGVFTMLYPTTWRIDTKARWSEDQLAFTMITMFAPRQATSARLDGHLSEGVRIIIEVPKKGYVFSHATPTAFAKQLLQNVMETGQQIQLLRSTQASMGQLPMIVYQFARWNPHIQENETLHYAVFANENMRMVVELVSPASQEEVLRVVFGVMVETFTMLR